MRHLEAVEIIAPEIQSFRMSLSFSPLPNEIRVWDWIAQGKVSIEMLKVSVEDSPTGTIIERMGQAYNEVRDLARAANIGELCNWGAIDRRNPNVVCCA